MAKHTKITETLTDGIVSVTTTTAKLRRWVAEEPTDKKSWSYKGYKVTWSKDRSAWIITLDGDEEWEAYTKGEAKEWMDC